MRLNQIIISGNSRQDYGDGQDSLPFLGKSIRLFFRQKLSGELEKATSIVFEELDHEALFERDTLFNKFSPQVSFDREDIGVRFRFGRREEYEESDLQKQENKEARKKEIEGLLSFDSNTYLDLYKYTFPKVAFVIIKEGGDKHIARDIFQNALIVLLERIKSDDFELTCSTGTYLHSVSVNIWRNLRRKLAHRVITAEIREFFHDMTETIYFEEIPEEYDRVASILEKIEDPCKSLLENFYLKGLSWDAIAEKLGYANAASARNQKYKCLEKIREIMTTL